MFTRLLAHAARAWPSQCVVCHAWPARSLCPTCAARFAPAVPRCRSCALPVPEGVAQCGACLRQPPPLHTCLAAVDWGWPWAALILRMKFGQDPGLAAPLAQLLAAAPGVGDALAQTDAVLPVPLSPHRLGERGYNPALLLARQVCAGHGAGAKVQPGWLQRTRHTPPQRGLPRAKRLKNVRGAFAVPADCTAQVQGRHLLMVDDVMTTGASLHEAARTLLAAGAASVSALTLARTGPDANDHGPDRLGA